MEEIEMYLEEAQDTMKKGLEHLAFEFNKIRAGKASPAMIESVTVDYYGSQSPISNVAAVNTPDARTLMIKPFEKGLINTIEKAIREANLGFNPQNDGESIRINIPMLTEERRRDLVKQAKGETEKCKITIRNIRKDTNEALKKLQKEGVSEDAVKTAEQEVQKLTDKFTAKSDELLAKKESEIMTI